MILQSGLLSGMLTVKGRSKSQDEMGTYYDGSYRGNDVIFQDIATCHTATVLSATKFQNLSTGSTAGKELHEVPNRAEKPRVSRTSRHSKKTMQADQITSDGGSIETAAASGPSVVAPTNPSRLNSVR